MQARGAPLRFTQGCSSVWESALRSGGGRGFKSRQSASNSAPAPMPEEQQAESKGRRSGHERNIGPENIGGRAVAQRPERHREVKVADSISASPQGDRVPQPRILLPLSETPGHRLVRQIRTGAPPGVKHGTAAPQGTGYPSPHAGRVRSLARSHRETRLYPAPFHREGL